MLDIPHGVTSPGRGGRGEALPVNRHGLLKVWSEQLLVQGGEVGADNVWVYCFERRQLFRMPAAQGSQRGDFAYQLQKEREGERS